MVWFREAVWRYSAEQQEGAGQQPSSDSAFGGERVQDSGNERFTRETDSDEACGEDEVSGKKEGKMWCETGKLDS